MHHIYICTYVHAHTPLAKPGFCSGGRISCKPNNGALLSTSINKNDDSPSPNYCALLGTRTSSSNDGKSLGAGMDIPRLLLAVINRNTHSTINYKCDTDSNTGTTHNSMSKNNHTSNSSSNSNRNSSNNSNDHDGSTKGTTGNNSVTSNTGKKHEGSDSSVSSISPSTSTNYNSL